MQEEWKIYIHTNLINGKVYIGQTKVSLNQRFGKDGKRYERSRAFYNAIKKYGWENFSHGLLEEHIQTQEEANSKEIEYIKKYKSNDRNYGYNISSGGNNCDCIGKAVYCYSMDGKFLTEYESVSKAERDLNMVHGKISGCCHNRHKSAGGYRWSYEKKEYLGEYKTDFKSRPVFQYSFNGEFIKKHESATKAIEEIRKTTKYKPNSAIRIYDCCNGKRNIAYKYQWSYEYKKSMKPTNARRQGFRVGQYGLNGDFIAMHDSLKNACEQFGDKKDKAYNAILHCCQGTSKTAYGYKWEYAD